MKHSKPINFLLMYSVKESKLIDFLLMYEMPWWCDFLFADWMQNLASAHIARSINTKLKRYDRLMKDKQELTKKE